MRCWSGIGAAVLAVAVVWYAHAGQKTPPETRGKGESALIKRGDYLVNSVALCTDCHTPQNDKGEPDRSRFLQGTSLPFQPKKKPKEWADEAPDITRSGIAGKWSEEEVVKFLSTGINPEGHKALPPMPPVRLHKEDARAVALYLKSLPGKEGKVGKGK